jgi:hypothetical protein
MAHLGEVSVEQKNQIIGELVFGEFGKRPEIAEQNDDLALGAVEIPRTTKSVRGLGGDRCSGVTRRSPRGRS